MLVSYNWLKELVEFPYSPDELSVVLTSQGMTVDALQTIGTPYDNIVVGELIEVNQHPDADKLSVCIVDTGKERLQIVCGAPGIKAGQKVPVALAGARLGDFTIKKTKLRGVESCGMCCAADELGISDDHESLLFLDESLETGTPFESIVKGEDHLFDLDIPGNRPDLLCHVGVAREIAAHMALKHGKTGVYQPPVPVISEAEEDVSTRVAVEIHDKELCPRYTARVIDGVYTAPSPPWMQARLYTLGMRPINNIVDITNYVLLEYGHPLHAFDYMKVNNGNIIVRRAKAGETMVTLDDIERNLDEDMLLIADDVHGLALAGVMGGALSAINEHTTSILLESAYFNGPNIRRTSRLLGLQSESSFRFERTVRGSLAAASARAAELLERYAGGTVLKGMADADYSLAPVSFTFNYDTCTELLGIDIPEEKAGSVLNTLGFELTQAEGRDMNVTVPEHRIDVAEGPDIAEELARMTGYDAIPLDTDVHFRSEKQLAVSIRLRERIRETMAGIGVREAYNPSLVSQDLLRAAGIPADAPEMDMVPLANASTQEQSVMRTLLYPGLIRNIQHNISHGAQAACLYEIGRKYLKNTDGRQFTEKETLAFVLWGDALQGSWCTEQRECDYYDGVSVLDRLCADLGITGVTKTAGTFYGCHPGRTAELTITINENTHTLGILAELDPRLLRSLDIPGRLVLAELDLAVLASAWKRDRVFQKLPRYPASSRDIAMFISEDHSHGDIIRTIENAGTAFLESAVLFDLYHGEQVPQGSRSMAYRVTYRAPDRTLTDEEVDAMHKQVLDVLVNTLQAQIR
jgi:phenylalanyl-tRNA synthetase beta chain